MNQRQESIKYGSVEVYISPVGAPADGITWFCCADRGLELFEKQYPLSDGMTYDSYIIDDEKLVVVDTVDHAVESAWREAIDRFLALRGGRKPDYLIVQHLEPDHSAAIESFMEDYTDCKLVCSTKAASMLGRFASGISDDRVVAVKEGEGLDIGSRCLRFFMAPMVHWPEVMVTYDSMTGVLFSADAFGTFGVTLAEEVARGVRDSSLLAELWRDEARRYYINICGKYGGQVRSLLKKASALELRRFCPLHGPVIELGGFNPVGLYDMWGGYEPEFPDKCLVLAASLHGNTVAAACRLAGMIEEEGLEAEVFDLAEADSAEVVSQAFACGAVVFMSATYDAGLVPSMRGVLSKLKSKNWQRRIVGIVENGSWAPIAGKIIADELAGVKDVSIVDPRVTVHTRLDGASERELRELASALADAVRNGVEKV